MRKQNLIIITAVVCLLPITAGLLLWNKLPESISTHFDINGNADGYSSKAETVFLIPSFLFLNHIILSAAALICTKRHQIGTDVFILILCIIPTVSVFSAFVIYAGALGLNVDTVFLTEVFSEF